MVIMVASMPKTSANARKLMPDQEYTLLSWFRLDSASQVSIIV